MSNNLGVMMMSKRLWRSMRAVMIAVGLFIVPSHLPARGYGVIRYIPKVFWHNQSTGEISAWLLKADGTVTEKQTFDWKCTIASGCARDWNVIGFSYIKYPTGVEYSSVTSPNLFWHNPVTGKISAWLLPNYGYTRVEGTKEFDWRCSTASGCARDWKPIGLGKLSLSSATDLFWHNQSTGEISVWSLKSDGIVTGQTTLAWQCSIDSGCAIDWKPIGISEDSDLFWHNPTTGEVSIWALKPDGTVTGTRELDWKCSIDSGCARDWKPIGLADLNDDGTDDIFWYNSTTGQVSVWLLRLDRTVMGKRSLSWQCSKASGCARDWKPIGVGVDVIENYL